MPNSTTKAPSKAQAIRQALKRYPEKGPTEISRLLSKRLGVPIRAKHVTVIKSKERNRLAPKPETVQAAARQTGERPRTTSKPKHGVADVVTTLKTYIERLGKDDLHQLIDAL